jgi:hypothetical protein
MPQSLGRQLLEQLIGKTVVEVSHTDADEIAAKTDMSLYLFFTDGTVLKAGPNTFQIFRPGSISIRARISIAAALFSPDF